MLKKSIPLSSVAFLLALGAALPAAAGEEDAAAPAGSFTSDMAIPMRGDHSSCHGRMFHFGHHARAEWRMRHHLG